MTADYICTIYNVSLCAFMLCSLIMGPHSLNHLPPSEYRPLLRPRLNNIHIKFESQIINNTKSYSKCSVSYDHLELGNS